MVSSAMYPYSHTYLRDKYDSPLHVKVMATRLRTVDVNAIAILMFLGPLRMSPRVPVIKLVLLWCRLVSQFCAARRSDLQHENF